MRARTAIVAVGLTLFAASSVAQCAEMNRYVNKDLGFELSYPASYRLTELPCGVARRFALDGLQSLLNVSTGLGAHGGRISLSLDRRRFSSARLETSYAHTGWDKPARIQIGKLTFFYYGAGGGGVEYTDDYFYDLRGTILDISFDGPYPQNGKSPSIETKRVERRLLESFRLLSAAASSQK